MRRVRSASAAVLLAVLTGCSAGTSGTPASAPVPSEAAAALGILSSVDYCGLVDLDRFGRQGYSVTGAALSSFDYCSVPLKLGDTGAELVVGPVVTSEQPPEVVMEPAPDPGLLPGLRIERQQAPGPRACSYSLVFSEGARLLFQARDTDSLPSGRLCDVAATAVNSAVSAIVGGRAVHRTYDDQSLGRTYMCALLGDEPVSQALGRPVKKLAGLTGHTCTWVTGDRGPSASLSLLVAQPPAVGAGTTVEDIGGRRFGITPQAGACALETAYRPVSWAGAGAREVVRLTMRTISADPCVQAKQVAAAFAAR